ncbi:flavin-binding monooxygenase-like family protein [Mollisia scopiformis]|uniref:Flavin-binding monooxygenase-like family protein n=1 Tax=Mollisia scopiformis TaxID=149040 RepID=A0A132B2X0_MOLSC|nr:flavin-binding monooxygenase-like family protein [Mollisia scopiformis]KUJ06745.1 flavin-binding monooxygenase-like family protein [Mollisia scopiformis]
MSDPNPSPTIDYGRHTNRADVLIIGAGISGMTTAIEMIRKGNGTNFIIVEKGNQVGGTWNDQRYPGCCCDVWSHLYSLSFEPNPNWTREYPGQEEILDYLVSIAHKYQLYRHIRFNTSVEEARWDETTNTWKTKINRLGSKDSEFGKEYIITSDFLVSGVGQLNVPKYPDIKGIDTFQGKAMHSARWDWDYDIRKKRIGIIGNGATAAQIIPEIAEACKSLTVFQRTPNWVVPREDKPISPTWQSIYRYVPFIRSRYRASLMDYRESFFDVVFDTKSPVHDFMMSTSKDHLATQLPGEKHEHLREQLQPHYAIGCKRVIITDDYFPTFARSNVQLETTAIEEITENGVKVQGGNEHELDLLILATGFKTTQFMYPIKIFGSNGTPIEEIWKSGASAYLGMTVPSMPNFSMLYEGPNTNLGHNSIILMIEAQALYINALIKQVRTARKKGRNVRIEPKLSVVQAYNNEIQARLRESAFADPNCNSWYKNEAGLITNNWSEAVVPYQKRTSAIHWDEFDISGSGAEDVKTKGETNWPRVIEETQVSNGMILTGLITAAGAITAGALYRNALKTLVKS